MSFPTRTLGKNGPQVTAIGLGLMSIGGLYGQKSSVDERIKFLSHAHSIGQHFWDTADIYADSEDIVGEWFKQNPGKRDDIFIASKFGIVVSGPNRGFNSSPEHLKAQCANSLKRLGVKTIDLYYCHRVDDSTPIEKTVEAMVELKKEGKIKYLGLSECSAATIRRAHAIHPISAYQIEYSPFFLDIELDSTEILKTCRELGIAVVAYSPVGRGLLTGQIKSFDDLDENDFRRRVPNFQGENFNKILSLVEKAKEIAVKHKATPAQVCLAWLLTQGDDIIPIPGTRTEAFVTENTEAANLKLSEDEVKELRKYAEATKLEGDRYPPGMTAALLRDAVPL